MPPWRISCTGLSPHLDSHCSAAGVPVSATPTYGCGSVGLPTDGKTRAPERGSRGLRWASGSVDSLLWAQGYGERGFSAFSDLLQGILRGPAWPSVCLVAQSITTALCHPEISTLARPGHASRELGGEPASVDAASAQLREKWGDLCHVPAGPRNWSLFPEVPGTLTYFCDIKLPLPSRSFEALHPGGLRGSCSQGSRGGWRGPGEGEWCLAGRLSGAWWAAPGPPGSVPQSGHHSSFLHDVSAGTQTLSAWRVSSSLPFLYRCRNRGTETITCPVCATQWLAVGVRCTLGLCTPGPDFAVLGPASASHLVGHTCSPPGPVPRKEVHDVRRASSSLFIAAHWTWSGSAWMAAGRAPRVPRGPPQLVLMPPWALRGI